MIGTKEKMIQSMNKMVKLYDAISQNRSSHDFGKFYINGPNSQMQLKVFSIVFDKGLFGGLIFG